jgi:Lrp/AsnC family leucine-responsive transcriptional regulator
MSGAPLDSTDREILALLQDNCKVSLSRIGELVGLSPPAVTERIRKLETRGVIRGYHAKLDCRRLGLDIAAFIGVSLNYPAAFEAFEREIAGTPDVLEIHHVTGAHTLLVKVKTKNTATLEALISRIRAVPGVERTETMVVLSTRVERSALPLEHGTFE